MLRRDISNALIATAAGAIGLSRRAEAQTRTAPFFAQTTAETTAGVMPTNYGYAPLSVDRYGNNTEPGTTPMTSAFNSAIAVARVSGGTVLYGQTAPYLVNSPINCTYGGDGNQPGFTIRNIGGMSHDLTNGILAKHTGVAVFDCTGNDAIEFYNVVIHTDPATYPQTGILFARNSHKGSQLNRINDCRIVGKFSVACFYNYGAEDDVLTGNYFANLAMTKETKVAVWTGNNVSGLKSSFVTIATGSVSCIDHNCFGNQYYNRGGTNTSDCVYLEQTDSWKTFGGWAYSASLTANGRALIYVDMSNAASNFGVIDGLTGENGTHLQAHCVEFSNGAFIATGWKIDSCRFPNAINAISAGASATLDNFHVRNVSEQASHGLFAAGTVQNSILDTVAMGLKMGTSKNNTLIGYSENWSIKTRIKDSWIDQGKTNKTWTANTDALTITGALKKRAICVAHGPLVTINLVLAAATSIVCAKGTAITGLPFAACDYSSDVSVTDITSQTALPGGFIEGGKLYLPAVNVATAEIVITATYFAA
jgi:hypothetical protein